MAVQSRLRASASWVRPARASESTSPASCAIVYHAPLVPSVLCADATFPDGSGGFLINDYGASVIRRLLPNGTMAAKNYAGTGVCAWSGDNGPASLAALCNPVVYALDGLGGMYVPDSSTHVIRRIFPNQASGVVPCGIMDDKSLVVLYTLVTLPPESEDYQDVCGKPLRGLVWRWWPSPCVDAVISVLCCSIF